jgi:hypothetical protein
MKKLFIAITLLLSINLSAQFKENCRPTYWVSEDEARKMPKVVDTIKAQLKVSNAYKSVDTSSYVTDYWIEYIHIDSNCQRIRLKRYFNFHVEEGYVIRTRLLRSYEVMTSKGKRYLQETFVSGFYPDIYLDKNKKPFAGTIIVWESF